MRRHIGVLGIALFAGSALGAPSPTRFYTVNPCRAVDTRLAPGPMAGPSLVGGQARSFALTGACNTPPTASAMAVNVTVVSPTADGYLSLAPAGTPAGATSTLNYRAGQIRANNAIAATSPAGLSLFCGQASGTTHVLVDVVGYFDDPAHNQPPRVNAGSPQAIPLAGTAHLAGTATDDGLPAPSALTYAWSLASGPAAPSFTAPTALATDVTFPQAGSYLLRLSASDGALTGWADVRVDVVGPSGPATLYIANLVPETGVVSSGSGTSTLLLAGNESSAVIRISFGNLTTPMTGMHVHGPADPGQSGQILFDLDSQAPESDGSWVWTFAPVGPTSVAQIVAALKAGRLYLNVHSSRYPSGEIRGHYGLSSGSTTFVPPPPPPPLPPGPPTAQDAARFLTQATWGPTYAEIQRVQQIGYAAWINQQLATPAASHLAYLDAARAAGEELSDNQEMEAIWKQAIVGPDQLRSRMAMALEEILVVSNVTPKLDGEGDPVAAYMDILNRDAFGSFRTLLGDVTKSPTMGLFLDMMGNDKENPETGQNPNENYAREILQLFSIGLYKLHPDGRLVLGADGLPIPTYGQDSVVGLAHVFTGWSHGGNPLTDDAFYWPTAHWRVPMQPWPTHHSPGAKSFLGVTLPAGGTPDQDLNAALDAIAAHPNVGPFMCRQLIQRLVTSNPSPAYVYRCGQVFANDGTGARGNLGAVVKTILTDWEARSSDLLTQQGFGKEREPILKYGALLRAFSAAAPSGKYRIWYLDDPIWGLGQNPTRAPSVFNFYPPDYAPPGEIAQAGLVAPEMKLSTETQIIGSTNYLRGQVWTTGGGIDDIVLDYSAWLPLASNAQTLVDRLDLVLCSQELPAEVKSAVVGALAGISNARDRIEVAVNLITGSPEFAIQR